MSQIPKEFKSCFWDTDFENLDLEKNRSFIISRLYTRGDFSGISWVHQTFSDQDVMNAAKSRRDLTPIVANYLRKKYGLRKEDMQYYRMQKDSISWR